MGEFGIYPERSLRLIVRQGHRHERDVIQVSCARARKMGVAEACDCAVGIEVSGYPVPAR